MAAGSTGPTTGARDMLVMRFQPNGQPDSTFGAGGRVVVNLGASDSANALALQPDGRIVVAGNTSAGTGDFAVIRLQGDPAAGPGAGGAGGAGGGPSAGAPRCGGKPATVIGTAGRDRLKGTKKADVIAGLGGNDTINGLAGNDIVCGGAGADKLTGGAGADRLLGDAGADTLTAARAPTRSREASARTSCWVEPAATSSSAAPERTSSSAAPASTSSRAAPARTSGPSSRAEQGGRVAACRGISAGRYGRRVIEVLVIAGLAAAVALRVWRDLMGVDPMASAGGPRPRA